MTPLKNKHPLMFMMDSTIISLPSPVNISILWNFGFLLSFCLAAQIFTGLFLSIHYSSDLSTAFASVNHIYRDINFGWMVRVIHSNTASMFFLLMYIHIARGIYFESFYLSPTWMVGSMIFLLSMATAFLGYVLPWGQMSLWGATVITNLFSVIPFIGNQVVQWLWGGFSVDSATLIRFFTFHFLLPFIILGMVGVHLMFLHQTGSTNPLGINSNYFKISFHPFFSSKDFLVLMFLFTSLMMVIFFFPWILADPENFIPANPLLTPVHIQPEWYFLFAYAILRSIPNKSGGVIALLMSVMVLFILPFLSNSSMKGNIFCPPVKIVFWVMVTSMILLTWIGACPVDGKYIVLGQIFTSTYFSCFLVFSLTKKLWESLLSPYKEF